MVRYPLTKPLENGTYDVSSSASLIGPAGQMMAATASTIRAIIFSGAEIAHGVQQFARIGETRITSERK